MKKILVMMALAVSLTGCGYSHEVVSKLKNRCEAIHGEVVYVKFMDGTVRSVDCSVDGVMFNQGDY